MSLIYPIILASGSKYRKELLEKLMFSFTQESPNINEDIYKNQNLSPEDLSLKLSQLKALDVFSRFSDNFIIASDQVIHLEGKIFSKPFTKEVAAETLLTLQGQIHELITSVTLLSPSINLSWSHHTHLKMRKLNSKEITDYLNLDQPYDCAGSYKLESFGISLFEKIQTTDYTSIIGLPLLELNSKIREHNML